MMHSHKFKIGQTVTFTPGLSSPTSRGGRYEVTRLLPADGSDNQYRVKNAEDGHERVVREMQLG